MGSPNVYNLNRLRGAIKPFRLHWFPRLRSTNDHAAVLRERGTLYAPAIVLAGHQTAGRGRGLHSWWSTAGCLTVTFVLPIYEAVPPQQVPLIAGLAVRRAAQKLVGASGRSEIQLKWPNDLLCNGRKLAGLLCERVRRVDLIGLGFNVNLDPAEAPADLRSRLTSLSHIAGEPIDMTDALAMIAKGLARIFGQFPETSFSQLLREYGRHDALRGKRVTVSDGDGEAIKGRCEGLDATGRLLVRDKALVHAVVAGQVML